MSPPTNTNNWVTMGQLSIPGQYHNNNKGPTINNNNNYRPIPHNIRQWVIQYWLQSLGWVIIGHWVIQLAVFNVWGQSVCQLGFHWAFTITMGLGPGPSGSVRAWAGLSGLGLSNWAHNTGSGSSSNNNTNTNHQFSIKTGLSTIVNNNNLAYQPTSIIQQ